MATLEPQSSPCKEVDEPVVHDSPPEPQPKSWRKAAMPVFACGAGLFSDGYINNARQGPPSLCWSERERHV